MVECVTPPSTKHRLPGRRSPNCRRVNHLRPIGNRSPDSRCFVEGDVTHFTSCATFPQSALRKGGATGEVRHATLNNAHRARDVSAQAEARSSSRGVRGGGRSRGGRVGQTADQDDGAGARGAPPTQTRKQSPLLPSAHPSVPPLPRRQRRGLTRVGRVGRTADQDDGAGARGAPPAQTRKQSPLLPSAHPSVPPLPRRRRRARFAPSTAPRHARRQNSTRRPRPSGSTRSTARRTRACSSCELVHKGRAAQQQDAASRRDGEADMDTMATRVRNLGLTLFLCRLRPFWRHFWRK